MNRFICIRLLVALLLAVPQVVVAQQVSRFPAISLRAGMHIIRAEVASTDAERQQGLMFRERLALNEGMLFVFDASASVCMWMKNTLIPLSVAFLDESGKIINIEDMQPHSTESHCSKKAAYYALEMNQGWFKKRNIGPGYLIDGLPR